MADTIAEVLTFPTHIEAFDSDERISFSKLDNKYLAVQSDGTEFEFDPQLKRWLPVLDEEEEALIHQQQLASYGTPPPLDIPPFPSGADDAGSDDNGGGNGARQGKKRKQDAVNGEDAATKPKKAKKPPRRPAEPKQNTAIYISNLPLDATADAVAELFSKGGMIAEEIDSGRKRIKMYTDAATGNFKGDALVVYFKPQSVQLAIMLLDDTDFRITESGLGSGKMRVVAADSSYKKTQYESKVDGEPGPKINKITGEVEDADPAAAAETNGSTTKPSHSNKDASGSGTTKGSTNNSNGKPDTNLRKGNESDRQKIIKKTQKLTAKLADWSDEDDSPSALLTRLRPGGGGIVDAKGGKYDKMVILSHMFTLQELEADPAALLDIKEDIREECGKIGEVTNVVLYDLEEDGIVSVKFRSKESAEACVLQMSGRSFGGQAVEAGIATGREKFRRTRKGDGDDKMDEDD